MMTGKQKKKRQYNLTYQLKKLGVECRVCDKTIYTSIDAEITQRQDRRIRKLCNDHYFAHQLQIPTTDVR